MKKIFSTKWTGSKQPRKQRKYLAKAPLHLKRKLLSVNLSKALRAIQNTRNVPVIKGDKVKIMRGKFKGKEGKVTEVLVKQLKIYIENIQTAKQDGSKANVPMRASNLQIIELNKEDKKRFSRKTATKNKPEDKKMKTETPKNETKPVNKEENKK